MNNSQHILTQILDIIGTSREGAASQPHVADFLTRVEVQVMTDLIQSLPPEKHNHIIDQFITLPDAPQKTEKILSPYYTVDQMRQSLKNATKKAIVTHFVEPHNNDLTPHQRDSILALLEKLT